MALPTVTLTQAQFDAIPTLAKQQASSGLVLKKFDPSNNYWLRLTFAASGDDQGNWPYVAEQIIRFEDIQTQHEQVGSLLVNQLLQKLKEQGLTQADEAAIINKVGTVLLALKIGAVRGASIGCAALTTDTVFTNARKNYLQTQIDNAIPTLL